MTAGVSGKSSIQANREAMARECGRTVLWIGNEAQNWSLADYIAAAQFARAHHVDCICPKLADGSIRWYGDTARLSAIRHAVLARGVGFIPFLYSYGPKLSSHQAHDEAAVVGEMLRVCPIVQIDMEAEWNGQAAAAAAFAAALRPLPGLVSISTWGDPTQQDWQGVARALSPSVNGWTPQEYTNWLGWAARTEYDPGVYTCMQPGIDLTQEFGANTQGDIIRQAVAHGARTFYFWEFAVARRNPGLLDQLVRLIDAEVAAPGSTAPAPAPAPTPAPTPVAAPREYTVVAGDTLSAIAAHVYGSGDLWHVIYDANKETVGDNPDLIKPGQVLTIPAHQG